MDKLPVVKGVAERWHSLAKEQKISAGILAFCGLAALILSVQKIQSNLGDPFSVTKSKYEEAKKAVEALSPEERADAEAKRRDTDGDGISDWDEENVYGTSPYLRDTDGDGYPDNAELALGKNPNCAEGRECAAERIDLSLLASSTGLMFVNPSAGSANELYAAFQRGMNAQAGSIASAAGVTTTGQTLIRDPVEIRKALKESGQFDQAEIDKITDAQLLQLYDEAMIQAAKQKSATTTQQ